MDYIKVLITLLLLLFYLPIFSALTDSWQMNPYYSHGFLVPLITAGLLWRKRKQINYSDRDFTCGAATLTIGLLIYGLGIFYKSLFISATSLIVVLAGLTLAFCSRKTLREITFPLTYLIFMIPLPYIDHISQHMQSISAAASTTILQTAGIHATNTATQIQLGTTTFLIGEPCSGMRTLIALLALSTLYLYLIKGHINKKILLLLSTVPLALTANILRITAILLIARHYGTDTAMQLFHNISSPAVFLLAFISLILISRCLGCSRPRNT